MFLHMHSFKVPERASYTNRAFVGFFAAVDPHVNEEFVPSVKRFGPPTAVGPITCELISFLLINVYLNGAQGFYNGSLRI